MLFLCLTAVVIVNAITVSPLGSALALFFIAISFPVSYLCGCGVEANVSAGLKYALSTERTAGTIAAPREQDKPRAGVALIQDWRERAEPLIEGT